MTNVKEPLCSSFEIKNKNLGIVSVLFQIPKCELEWFQFQVFRTSPGSKPVLTNGY
jgi:transposase-like protein